MTQEHTMRSADVREDDLPLDHPSLRGPYRIYFALTNHCNRACPWCSTCSSPRGSTWLSLDDYVRAFPEEGDFEVQLEGGEPTLHPDFAEFARTAREHPRCTRLVVCTNGVVLPRERGPLRAWLDLLGERCTLKLAVNHHLLERDAGLLALAGLIHDLFDEMGGDRLLVLNVRLRKGDEDDDAWVRDAVVKAGLIEHANVFFLQRYGFAEGREEWDRPFLVDTKFTMVNPDGRDLGSDLIARSEAMRRLP